MPSLVWCPPGWCCGNLYLVSNLEGWCCPKSGVRAHTVLSESQWLDWSEPQSMLRLFAGHERKLDLVREAARQAGLEHLLESSEQGVTVKPRRQLCDLVREVFGNP